MPFARLSSTIRLIIAAVLLGMLTIAGWAQDTPAAPVPQNTPETRPLPVLNYSQPVSHFPNPIGPYTARHLAAPNLANTARMDQFMRDGKLYLSLNDAIALALENNLDIAIARYNLNIADTDVLRAKAGASILGTPLVWCSTRRGAESVASAQTQVHRPAAPAWAQAVSALVPTAWLVPPWASGRTLPALTQSWLAPCRKTVSTSFPVALSVRLLLRTRPREISLTSRDFSGALTCPVGFNNSRIASGNQPFTTLSPSLSSSFKLQLTQHLLQGFGFAANTRFIHIAKNNRELSDVAFRLQIIDSIDQIENIYWDLVYAYENARVQNESLAFAQKTLSDTKKQVEIGSLAPIEVVRAQSTVATNQQAVTAAQTNLQLEQLLMKNALTRTLKDPVLATAEVIPTSTMDVPAQEPVVPTEDLINEALRHRAELVESRIDLNSRELSNKAVRSSLLPTLDLFAYYGGSGLGGAQNPANVCQTSSQQFCASATPDANLGQFPLAPNRGYTDTLNQLDQFHRP